MRFPVKRENEFIHKNILEDCPTRPSGNVFSFFSSSADIKKILSENLGHYGQESWFAPLDFSADSIGRNLTITVPHELFFKWYSLSGLAILESKVRELFGRDTNILYRWPTGNISSKNALQSPTKNSCEVSPSDFSESFDDFITGSRNRESLLLLRHCLCEEPSTVFIHGPSGSGKSHLLRASCAELLEQNKGHVFFFSCHDFISVFRNASLKNKTFTHPCRAIIVDDIHLLEKHTDIQEELAHMLDTLSGVFFLASYQSSEYDECGQKLLPKLYDRLCSRFSLGLTEPDLDVRLRFTQQVMQKKGLPEHRGTALFLARKCLRLRHINGLLEHVRLSYEQSGVLPDQSELSDILGRAGTPQPLDVDTILATVASHYGCSPSELCENTKDRRLSLPRQTAMYLCRELLSESYHSLGLIFGGKDHSTVMYAIRKIEKLRVTNKDANIQLTELTKQCRNGIPRGRK